MPDLNIARYIQCTESEGPGERFALWVQGCLKRCPGCCNPDMLEIQPRSILSCDSLMEKILSAKCLYGIEGITFVGGEPFLQAKGLSYIAEKCQWEGLSVLVFTGYTLEELRRLRLPFWNELLKSTDILVDGPFIDCLNDATRTWVGSNNQRVYYLSKFYQPGLEFSNKYVNSLEIRIAKGRGSTLQINGSPCVIEINRRRRAP